MKPKQYQIGAMISSHDELLYVDVIPTSTYTSMSKTVFTYIHTNTQDHSHDHFNDFPKKWNNGWLKYDHGVMYKKFTLPPCPSMGCGVLERHCEMAQPTKKLNSEIYVRCFIITRNTL